MAEECCETSRLDEAGAWMDTVLDLQAEVARLKEVEKGRNAMLAVHFGYGDGEPPRCVECKTLWPCKTYTACFPELAWKAGEQS